MSYPQLHTIEKNTPGIKALWDGSADVIARTLDHPFLRELGKGTLPEACFMRYLVQDEFYLGGYARHMEMLSGMLQDPQDSQWMRSFAQESVQAEHEMHRLLESRLQGNSPQGPSKVTLAYESYASTSLEDGDVQVALSALLPCTWIYCEVGLAVLQRSCLEGNPFRQWILAYADEGYQRDTDRFLEIADRHLRTMDDDTMERLKSVFRQGAILEYAFWDSAYYDDDNMDRILLDLGESKKITSK